MTERPCSRPAAMEMSDRFGATYLEEVYNQVRRKARWEIGSVTRGRGSERRRTPSLEARMRDPSAATRESEACARSRRGA